MGKNFDYEESFMGIRNDNPKKHHLSFREEYRLESLKRVLPKIKGKVLDIGCGAGLITESLPYYYPDAEIYGCDISRSAIEYARKYGKGKVEYEVLRGKKFPYKNNFFDVCICFDVLEHVPDADFFLNEAKRVLKKGGYFFLIVPCEGQPLTYTWFFKKIKHGDNLTYKYFGHIHPEFTYSYVEKVLLEKGFLVNRKLYSEHVLYQILHLFVYFLPKQILDRSLGEKNAKKYSDSGVLKINRRSYDPFIIIRRFWFAFTDLVLYPMYWETILLKNLPLAAWKLHILVQKK